MAHISNLNKAYTKRHEKIYEAVKLKEVYNQWMSLQKKYEKQKKSKLVIELEDH